MTQSYSTVRGVHLLIMGKDRDIKVSLSEIEYCIDAIRKGDEHKALSMLEDMAVKECASDEALEALKEALVYEVTEGSTHRGWHDQARKAIARATA